MQTRETALNRILSLKIMMMMTMMMMVVVVVVVVVVMVVVIMMMMEAAGSFETSVCSRFHSITLS
jgi:heme/copper-type cytochrome/quinol oxidase subunit 2